MPRTPPASIDHSCPGCGRVFVVEHRGHGTCPSCGVATKPVDAVPRATGRAFERRFAVHRWFLAGGTLGAGGTVVASVALHAASGALIVPALLAFVAGAKTALAIGRRRTKRRAAAWANAAVRTPVAPSLREAGAGQVQIVGLPSPLVTVASPRGTPCIAFEERGAEYDGDFHIRGAGGQFELFDGSGVRARVDARHVTVFDDGASSIAVIEPGRPVAVVGIARWVASEHEAAGGPGLREAARRLEVSGTPDCPVVIRALTAEDPLAIALARRRGELPAPQR